MELTFEASFNDKLMSKNRKPFWNECGKPFAIEIRLLLAVI